MQCCLIAKRKLDMLMMFVLCILVFMPRYINAFTDPSDVAALADMYSSLGSPPQLTNWNSSNGDPCEQSWKGITCSGSRVTQIQLPNLSLSGQLGFQLASLTSVTIFDFSNNTLGGELPYQLPPNGRRLNLANNQFTGGIPYSISLMSSLRYMNLKHNQLQGQLSNIFGQLSSLAVMDISFNALTGDLPESFGNLSSIKTLFMQNNQFTGTIDVLADLPLENLNVAHNQFTGLIPDKLKKINLHKDGNSWGSGPAPTSPPGTPPSSRTNPEHESGPDQTQSDSREGKKSRIGAVGIAGILISILLVGGIIAFFVLKKRSKKPPTEIEKLDRSPHAPNERPQARPSQPPSIVDIKTFDAPVQINMISPPLEYHKSFHNEESPEKAIIQKKANIAPTNVKPFSIADLQMSTGSFNIENLLGEGSVGRVYRAQFNGKILAVKKIKSSAISSELSDDFMDIVSNISRLHHPNLTELVGFCSEHGQHLLVYEFHKNGSLYEYLHPEDGDRKPLIWNSRVKIALGSARALEYLHEVCSPSVVHKNIESTNILLDSELNPHLSDCGLASCFSNVNQVLEHNATSGYSAPEVSISAQYTLKSDVYSFGVVMLELLTGRKPFDSSRPRSEQSLVQWATSQLHNIDALSKMVDPALNSLYPVKSLSRFADVIALCIQPEPEFRPTMSEIVRALVRLLQRTNMSKRTYGADQGTSQHNKADRYD